MSVWPSFQTYLLKYQIEDEDQLFRVIYEKTQLNKQFPLALPLQLKDQIDDDKTLEEDYFRYKQDTYISFVASAALTIPSAIGVAVCKYANKNIASETVRLQRLAKVIISIGLPSFALFNIGVYRRFFKSIDSEVLLRKKYAAYLVSKEARRNY